MKKNTIPTTASLLAEKYEGQPFVPLEKISEEYLGFSRSTLMRKATLNTLPFPVVRLSKSQKSPWFVSFDQLVRFVERQSQEACRDWSRMKF